MQHKPGMGLHGAINTAKEVGAEVRGMMVRNSGIAPENLEAEENVNKAKSKLKKANKKMLKHDTPK